ncbi:hypothetical protein [Chryseolinea lacunae]|uniref:S-adenosyl-methyltransferase n=1 Tax=Chryseolinea lacunae TaxID=2801331 RepID=A0ABS1L3Q0_9BACT|nr:hypothetical protein [Chryseolinea lacunae]MBL0745567.1 hypothetical protein [Chryseolinea lacunae]
MKKTASPEKIFEINPDEWKKWKVMLSLQTMITVVGFSFTCGLLYSKFDNMKEDIESLKARGPEDKKELILKIEELSNKTAAINDRTIVLQTKMEGLRELLVIKKP